MKISKAQVLQIIQEEAQKVKQEILLRRELASIEKELEELNEVHAGGNMDPGKDGVHDGQKKAVFTKKGTHLVEDEDIENDENSGEEATADVEDAMSDDTDSEDVELDAVDADSMGEGEISIDAVKAAVEKLGADLGLTGQIDFDAAAAEDAGLGDTEGGLGVDIETGAEDAVAASMEPEVDIEEEEVEGAEDSSAGSDKEIDECGDEMPAENNGMAENKKLNEEVARWKKLAGL